MIRNVSGRAWADRPFLLEALLPEGDFVGVKDEGIGQLHDYRQALAKHGLDTRADYVVSGYHEDSVGYQGMCKLLQLTPRPDEVFCFTDPVGAGGSKRFSKLD